MCQPGGSLRRFEQPEQREPVLPDRLGVGLPLRGGLGQAAVFDAAAIPLMPIFRRHAAQPVRLQAGDFVEGGAQGLADEFQAAQRPHGGQHMGRIRPLPSLRFHQSQFAALAEKPLQQLHFGPARDEPCAKFAEHRKVEARIVKLKPQQIFPIDAGAHGFGGLAVREVLAELEEGDERQEPGRKRRLAAGREERGKILVAAEGAQLVPQCQVGRAFGKGCACNLGRLLGNRHGQAGIERHGKPPAEV